jgi:hypothetical protein
MRLMTAAALTLSLSMPAVAESIFPVSVPQECMELATREGVPTVIENRYQAIKARVKLYRLSTRDPLVRECRQAVERLRSAMQEQTASNKERTASKPASTFSLSSSPASASPRPAPAPQSPAMGAPQ